MTPLNQGQQHSNNGFSQSIGSPAYSNMVPSHSHYERMQAQFAMNNNLPRNQ